MEQQRIPTTRLGERLLRIEIAQRRQVRVIVHTTAADDSLDLARRPIRIEDAEQVDALLAHRLEAREDHDTGSPSGSHEPRRCLNPEMICYGYGLDGVPETSRHDGVVIPRLVLVPGRFGVPDEICIRIYLERDAVEARARRAAKGRGQSRGKDLVCDSHREHVTWLQGSARPR